MAQRMDFHNFYQITIKGAASGGLMGANGVPLEGAINGTPGSSFVGLITEKMLDGPSIVTIRKSRVAKAVRTQAAHAVSASAVDRLAVSGRLHMRKQEQPRG